MSVAISCPNGIGISFEDVDIWVPLRGAGSTSTASVGHVVVFCVADVAQITADGVTSTALADGVVGGLLSSVTRSYTSTDAPKAQWAGVVQEVGTPNTTSEVGASNTLYRVRVAGVTQAFVQHPANTSVGRGAPLIISDGATTGETAGYLQARGRGATSTATARYVGIMLDTSLSGTTSTGGLAKVLFDGLNGFGSANDLG